MNKYKKLADLASINAQGKKAGIKLQVSPVDDSCWMDSDWDILLDCENKEFSEYCAMAIENHDSLVAEIESLKEKIKSNS